MNKTLWGTQLYRTGRKVCLRNSAESRVASPLPFWRLKMLVLSQSFLTRFWSRVNKTKSCWLWSGAPGSDGYGEIFINRKSLPKHIRTHRVSWILHFGEIPDGLHILHRCDNPPCVNPKHLWLGTNKDNMSDMTIKGRRACGEKHGKSKITEKDVRRIRALYASGKYLYRQLGKKFGLSLPATSLAARGITWAHVK